MPRSLRSLRALWVFATGFLGLDAILLVIAGRLQGRPMLYVWAIALGLLAAAVGLSWSRYQVRLAELDAANRSVKADIEELRDAVRRADVSR